MSHCLSQTAFSHLCNSGFKLLRSHPVSGGRIGVRAFDHFNEYQKQLIDEENKKKADDHCQNQIKQQQQVKNGDDHDHCQKQIKQQQMKKRVTPIGPTLTISPRPHPALETMESPLAYNRQGRMPQEMKEGEEEYKLRFDMPGMTKEDVKVWVEEKKILDFKAEKIPEDGAEHWPAKSYGWYSSRIALPGNVDFEKIKAEVKDGVLYITLPKVTTSAKLFYITVN